MSELNPDMAAPIVAACKAGAEEAAGSLARALGGEFILTVGEPAPLIMEPAPAGFDGASLVVLLQAGDAGVAIAIPQSSGIVPEWCVAPDASGESRLATLAQELGMLLLPETIPVTAFKAQLVSDVGAAIKQAQVSASGTLLPIDVVSGDKSARLSMLWPLAAPGQLFAAAAAKADERPTGGGTVPEGNAAAEVDEQPRDLSALPGYSRSLLKISVPVSVQLASKKESVQDVIGLAPGSIIKFDKGCEELLQMIVGEHAIAEGEAVKIGEKFGFRVMAMKLPPEHFVPVKKKPQQRRRA